MGRTGGPRPCWSAPSGWGARLGAWRSALTCAFAGFFVGLRERGAWVIVVPGALTSRTGALSTGNCWSARRALDTWCFVVAASQWGRRPGAGGAVSAAAWVMDHGGGCVVVEAQVGEEEQGVVARRRGWLSQNASALVELCYPVRCWGCGERWPRPGEWLCEECLEELVGHGLRRCGRCGQFVGPELLVGGGCWECHNLRFSFAAAVSAVPYGEVARVMMHRFKYRGEDYLARLMGVLMVEVARRERLGVLCEVVVGVPLHWRRRLGRGFDQALALAAEVARGLGLPLAARAVVRSRHTQPQSGLSRAQRRGNVAGGFKVTEPGAVQERTVLAVDDVLTTGATAEACAQALLEGGARRVFVLSFARAGKPLPAGPASGGRGEDV